MVYFRLFYLLVRLIFLRRWKGHNVFAFFKFFLIFVFYFVYLFIFIWELFYLKKHTHKYICIYSIFYCTDIFIYFFLFFSLTNKLMMGRKLEKNKSTLRSGSITGARGSVISVTNRNGKFKVIYLKYFNFFFNLKNWNIKFNSGRNKWKKNIKIFFFFIKNK